MFMYFYCVPCVPSYTNTLMSVFPPASSLFRPPTPPSLVIVTFSTFHYVFTTYSLTRTRRLSKTLAAPCHPPAPPQCVLEEMARREVELGTLREKAHHLWEGQAAGKGFVHRVSQLSAQYLALSNLTKVTQPPHPVTPHSLLPTRHRRLCAPATVSVEAEPSEFCDHVTGNVEDVQECREVAKGVQHSSPVEAVR